MCGCLEVVGRIVIAILSTISLLLGFGLLGLGIILKTQTELLAGVFSLLSSQLTSQASAATGGNVALSEGSFDLSGLFEGLAIAFIIAGIILFVISVFGIAASCCKVKWMLIVYVLIMAVFLISQVVLISILAAKRGILTDPPKAQLQTSLQAEYQGINGTDIQSLVWNGVMQGFQCCGVEDSTDFASAPKWISVWGPGSIPNFQVPAICCKTGQFTDQTSACITTPDNTNSNKATGCYNKILDYFLTGTPFIAFACCDIGLFALLTLFASIILYSTKRTNKVGDMN